MWTLLWSEERSLAAALLCIIGINFDVDVGRAPLEGNFDLIFRRLHYDEILMLPLGGLHV
jgi:hypothetical protein